MFVNRGIYHQGWTAVTRHSDPLGSWPRRRPLRRRRLGALRAPTTGRRRTNLAAEQPERLAHLQRLFLIEAAKYNVLPLDDRRVERFNADMAGRPQADPGQPADPVRRHGPADRELVSSSRTSRTPSRPRSWSPRAAPPGRSSPRAAPSAAGASTCKDGKPAYCYNLFGLQRFKVYGPSRSRPASTRSGWSSPTTAAGSARAARRRSTSTAPRSARAGSRRRCRWSSPPTRPPTSAATPARRSPTTSRPAEVDFTGRVNWVELDLGEDAEDTDHLISPEERYRIAMARQ